MNYRALFSWSTGILLTHLILLRHICLWGFACPMLFIYPLVFFPYGSPRLALLAWAFVTGLIIDTFANTPGMTTATLTLTAFLQPLILRLFTDKDLEDNTPLTPRSMGIIPYWEFVIMLTLIQTSVYFAIEACTFFHLKESLTSFGSSFALTLVLILAVERLRHPKN